MMKHTGFLLLLVVIFHESVAARDVNRKLRSGLVPSEDTSKQLEPQREDEAQDTDLSFCQDTLATFPVDEQEQSCDWLATQASEEQQATLCGRHEISSLCRVTCDVCLETIQAVQLLETCSDAPGTVQVANLDLTFTCEWLGKNLKAYRHACATTAVALHCPATCDTFSLCRTGQVDPSA